MEMRQKAHRIGLGIKLGMMLIVCILVIALGFLRITYGIYSRKVNDIYLTKAERAASHMANYHLPAQYTGYLRKMIDTEEFRRVRARAEAENDEQIIRNWMLQQPSVDLAEGRLKPDPSGMTG